MVTKESVITRIRLVVRGSRRAMLEGGTLGMTELKTEQEASPLGNPPPGQIHSPTALVPKPSTPANTIYNGWAWNGFDWVATKPAPPS